jgi:hypothetical protein
MHASFRLWPFALLPLLVGCESLQNLTALDRTIAGPFFTPTNYQAAARLPIEIRRVVVLPVADDGALTEETLNSLDTVVRSSLSRAQRFEIVPLPRADCVRLTGGHAIRSVDALPHDLLTRIVNDYAADAVLFVDVTQYSPYPPISLGLRAKLARTDDRGILWSFDNVFTATDPTVVNAARRYWRATAPAGAPGDFSVTALESPLRFAAYATSATFDTLPPRS